MSVTCDRDKVGIIHLEVGVRRCVCVYLQMETNPVLKNITDYLIEEVSAEEEELTGAAGGGGVEAGDGRDPNSADVTVETDEKLLKVRRANNNADVVID